MAERICSHAAMLERERVPHSASAISHTATMPSHCGHRKFVVTDTPNTSGCEECLAMGDTWVHLRLCRTCGHVGCCDDSKNRHATKHFHSTQHPIVTSLEPGDDWSWCYVDELLMELD